jgi:hypothetical protein
MAQYDSPFIEELDERRFLFEKHLLRLDNECRKLLTLFFTGNALDKILLEMGFKSMNTAYKRKFLCKQKLMQKIKSDKEYTGLLGR